MVTINSIDLKKMKVPCFALAYAGQNYDTGCKILNGKHKHCGTYRCPFYKPSRCKEWIRIDDRSGVNIIPPEDLTWGGKKK